VVAAGGKELCMPFRDDELEISFYKSRGPGGQKKNVTESAVRVRHLPTGLVVTASESRSQHRNKAAALEELERRLALRRRRRKPRVATRPSAASRRRRADSKRRLSEKKELRRRPETDE
jgi:protein subunit release factor A